MQQTKLYKRVATSFETLPPGTPESFLKLRSLGVGKVEVVVFVERSSTTQRYELLRTTECGDKEAPFLLTASMTPLPANEEDFNDWYDEEHVPMVSQMAGYLRCRRCVSALVAEEGVAMEEQQQQQRQQPKYFTIHEVEDLAGFAGPEARASGETEWTKKHMAQLKGFEMRGWELIKE
ncbi:hypothetical protein D6D18_08887 [Aureobasidium pullulans]|nr:hypothetical protein D6D18_08887 [Aureobasidium pullulans]